MRLPLIRTILEHIAPDSTQILRAMLARRRAMRFEKRQGLDTVSKKIASHEGIGRRAGSVRGLALSPTRCANARWVPSTRNVQQQEIRGTIARRDRGATNASGDHRQRGRLLQRRPCACLAACASRRLYEHRSLGAPAHCGRSALERRWRPRASRSLLPTGKSSRFARSRRIYRLRLRRL